MRKNVRKWETIFFVFLGVMEEISMCEELKLITTLLNLKLVQDGTPFSTFSPLLFSENWRKPLPAERSSSPLFLFQQQPRKGREEEGRRGGKLAEH